MRKNKVRGKRPSASKLLLLYFFNFWRYKLNTYNMKQANYLKLIEKHPEITSEGLGVNMDYANGLSQEDYFALRRDELKVQLDKFELCLDWLEQHPIEGKRNAHYWKDRIQQEYQPEHSGYFHIPRGTFILAALYEGLSVEKMTGSTDAWISK